MDKVLVRNALQGMIRATDDDSTPIIRRLARVQARAALEKLDAEAASGVGEREDFANMTAGEAIAVTAGNDTLMRDLSFAYVSTTKRMPAVAAVIDRARIALAASLPPATDPAMVERETIEMCARAMAEEAKAGPWDRMHETAPRGWGDTAGKTYWRNMAAIAAAALAAAPTIPATGEAE